MLCLFVIVGLVGSWFIFVTDPIEKCKDSWDAARKPHHRTLTEQIFGE